MDVFTPTDQSTVDFRKKITQSSISLGSENLSRTIYLLTYLVICLTTSLCARCKFKLENQRTDSFLAVVEFFKWCILRRFGTRQNQPNRVNPPANPPNRPANPPNRGYPPNRPANPPPGRQGVIGFNFEFFSTLLFETDKVVNNPFHAPAQRPAQGPQHAPARQNIVQDRRQQQGSFRGPFQGPSEIGFTFLPFFESFAETKVDMTGQQSGQASLQSRVLKIFQGQQQDSAHGSLLRQPPSQQRQEQAFPQGSDLLFYLVFLRQN